MSSGRFQHLRGFRNYAPGKCRRPYGLRTSGVRVTHVGRTGDTRSPYGVRQLGRMQLKPIRGRCQSISDPSAAGWRGRGTRPDDGLFLSLPGSRNALSIWFSTHKQRAGKVKRETDNFLGRKLPESFPKNLISFLANSESLPYFCPRLKQETTFPAPTPTRAAPQPEFIANKARQYHAKY